MAPPPPEAEARAFLRAFSLPPTSAPNLQSAPARAAPEALPPPKENRPAPNTGPPPPTPSKPKPKPKPKPNADPDPDLIAATASYHASCVLALPRLSLPALSALLRAAAHPPSRLPRPPIPPGTPPAAYVHLVLQALLPRLLLPYPVLSGAASLLPPRAAPFPAISSPPWALPYAALPPAPLPARLLSNLEAAWDQLLDLHRRFRGDVHGAPAARLEPSAALNLMAALHPAALDLFAARLLALVAQSALAPADPKMHRLFARLSAAGPASPAPTARKGARRDAKGRKPVVLHRLPPAVRHSFSSDASLQFALDFLTTVDSARLAGALAPRAAASVRRALAMAAAATSNAAFTDSVIEARLYARVLAVCIHAPNWAHSEHAVEGEAKGEMRGLDTATLRARVPLCSAAWTAAFPLADAVESAVQSGQTLAVVAVVAVADVMLRLAAVDPVAIETDWYRAAAASVSGLQVRAKETTEKKSDDGDAARAVSMPLVDLMIGGLSESHVGLVLPTAGPGAGTGSDKATVLSDRDTWQAIGDARLLREVCPLLDVLRRELLSPPAAARAGGKAATTAATKMATRRIRPVPAARGDAVSTLGRAEGAPAGALAGQDAAFAGLDTPQDDGEEEMEATLRREFYARMDGRLRELMRVVVTSRPGSGETARERFTQVAGVLYPDTAGTVVAVAAGLCAAEAGKLGGGVGTAATGKKVTKKVTKKEALAARLAQVVRKGEEVKEGEERRGRDEGKTRRRQIAVKVGEASV